MGCSIRGENLPVIILEVGYVSDVGDGEVADEEGGLPVDVIDFGLSSHQTLGGHHLLEPLLHAALVVLLRQPLHCVHQLVWYPMVHHLTNIINAIR